MTDVCWLTALLITLLLGATQWNRWRRGRLIATIPIRKLPGFASQHLANERDVLLFLPPGYDDEQSAAETPAYPVLYLNDGQDVDQLQLRETLARLTARGQINPLIVVAVPTNEERLQEYGTAITANAQGMGANAGAYTKFVAEELMPHVSQEFRVRAGPNHTAVLGASLGGLSAFDLAWNYPQLFGSVGVFSGSFWWRAGADDAQIAPGRLIAHEMVRNGRFQPGLRFWFEAGTQDETADRDNNGVIDAIQDTVELIDELEKKGYRRGPDLVYLEVPGGRHNYDTWSQVLPDFLTWAFPASR